MLTSFSILEASDIQQELDNYQTIIKMDDDFDPRIAIKFFRRSLDLDDLNQSSKDGSNHIYIAAANSLYENSSAKMTDEQNYQFGRLNTYYSYFVEKFSKPSHMKANFMESGKKFIRIAALTAQDNDIKRKALYFAWLHRFIENLEENKNFLDQAADLGLEKAKKAQELMLLDQKFKDFFSHPIQNHSLFKIDKSEFENYLYAAAQGDSYAQFNLAECYTQGRGVEQSNEQAFKYYQQTADLGNMEAQFEIAECYAQGRGVEQKKF